MLSFRLTSALICIGHLGPWATVDASGREWPESESARACRGWAPRPRCRRLARAGCVGRGGCPGPGGRPFTPDPVCMVWSPSPGGSPSTSRGSPIVGWTPRGPEPRLRSAGLESMKARRAQDDPGAAGARPDVGQVPARGKSLGSPAGGEEHILWRAPGLISCSNTIDGPAVPCDGRRTRSRRGTCRRRGRAGGRCPRGCPWRGRGASRCATRARPARGSPPDQVYRVGWIRGDYWDHGYSDSPPLHR